jgi:AcrR family transcriptional regulator
MLGELGSEEALSLRAVAREVGIAAPSVYRHFSDKAELVRAVLAGEYEQLARCMAEAGRAADPSDPMAGLRAQLHAYCSYAMDNPGHYRLMFGIRQSPSLPGSGPGSTADRDGVAVRVGSAKAEATSEAGGAAAAAGASGAKANGTTGGGGAGQRHPVWVVLDCLDAMLARCEEAGCRLRLVRDRSVIVLFVGVHGRVALWHAFGRTDPEPVHAFVEELLTVAFDD